MRSLLLSLLIHTSALSLLWAGASFTSHLSAGSNITGAKSLMIQISAENSSPDVAQKLRPPRAGNFSKNSGKKMLEAASFSGATHGVLTPLHPDYPVISRRSGEEGEVLLSVKFGERGTVLEVAIDQSSGHARLDEAAVRAAKQMILSEPPENMARISFPWTKKYSVLFRLTQSSIF